MEKYEIATITAKEIFLELLRQGEILNPSNKKNFRNNDDFINTHKVMLAYNTIFDEVVGCIQDKFPDSKD